MEDEDNSVSNLASPFNALDLWSRGTEREKKKNRNRNKMKIEIRFSLILDDNYKKTEAD